MMMQKIKQIWRVVSSGANLMIGVSSYEAYIRHMQQQHPHIKPMTHAQFVTHCMEARYGGKKQGKCPC